MKKDKHQAQLDLQDILDTFSGADGGVSFVLFRNLIDSLVEKEKNGDENATQILLLVTRFNRLIQIASKGI